MKVQNRYDAGSRVGGTERTERHSAGLITWADRRHFQGGAQVYRRRTQIVTIDTRQAVTVADADAAFELLCRSTFQVRLSMRTFDRMRKLGKLLRNVFARYLRHQQKVQVILYIDSKPDNVVLLQIAEGAHAGVSPRFAVINCSNDRYQSLARSNTTIYREDRLTLPAAPEKPLIFLHSVRRFFEVGVLSLPLLIKSLK